VIEEHVDPTTETHAQIANLIRTLVTAAAGVAEKRAQRREAEQREAARQSDIARHAFEERIRAEREIAYLIYRNVERDRWWERATPNDIANIIEVAGTWATTDPRAQAALNRIKEELHHRYGIDLQHGATPAEVLDQVEAAKQAAQGATTSQQEHIGGPARPPWEQEILDAAGDELGRQVIASEGWPQLQNRLNHLQASGVDVHERLRNAVIERELDTAVDKAITLVWRLKPGPHNPVRTKPAGPAKKGSPPPGKRIISESDPERFVKKKMATEHHRYNGPGPVTGR
jgi:hypothetical protein